MNALILVYNAHKEHFHLSLKVTIISVSRALILSVNTDLRTLLDPVVWWCRGREGLTPGFPFKNLLIPLGSTWAVRIKRARSWLAIEIVSWL